jgi:hypothetical protein
MSDIPNLDSINPNWRLKRPLGRGGEGTVYLVEDTGSRLRYVVKLFHRPRSVPESKNLLLYADRVDGPCIGLPKINLVMDSGQLRGVFYVHRPLYRVHRRLLLGSEHLQKALVGAYCAMQRHLLSRSRMVLWDADAQNFLLDRDGIFHWTDFGWGIAAADHPWNARDGHVGYGFAMLLLSVHGINIKPRVVPQPGYSLAEPCRYCADSRLDALAARHGWLHRVITMARAQPGSAFLSPAFYAELASGLPTRVHAARAVIAASALIAAPGRAKRRVTSRRRKDERPSSAG